MLRTPTLSRLLNPPRRASPLRPILTSSILSRSFASSSHRTLSSAVLPRSSPATSDGGAARTELLLLRRLHSSGSHPQQTPTPPTTSPPSSSQSQFQSRSRLSPPELSRLQEEAQRAHFSRRNRSLAYYSLATIIFAIGLTYAAVPLYRAFCSATGFGGTPMVGIGRFEPSRLVPSNTSAQRIRVTFNTDCSDELPWSFKPSQEEIFVIPGETALAFFTAKSQSKKDIIGIATYNVAPDRIAPYFSKVECFCFEEQRLLAGEEVDLPVFFFIDNDFLDDPNVRDVKDVVLSYTFFAARRNAQTGQMEPDTDLENYSVGMDLPGVK